jgi:hypothetical protein
LYVPLSSPIRVITLHIITPKLIVNSVVLGGVVVIVLAIGSKVLAFKPGRGDVFLKTIKSEARHLLEGN